MIAHALDILLVGGVALLALALGSRLLAGLRVECPSTLERAVMATGLGLGVIAYLMLGLGLLGGLQRAVVVTVLLVLFGSQGRGIYEWLRLGGKWLKEQRHVQRSLVERALTVYLVITSLLLLLASLCPPTGSDWDGLTYHLAAPKNFLRHGRIFYIAFDHHSNFPFTVEMLYLLGLSLRGWTMEATGGAVAAKLFHTLFALLSAATIYAFGRRHLSRPAGLVGAAVFLSMPIVASEAVIAYADLGLAAFTLLALYAFWNGKVERSKPSACEAAHAQYATLSAIFAGLCMGTKYSGLLIFGWLGLMMLGDVVRARSSLRPLLIFALVGALVASPWYVKNVVYTRNPVYPFLYKVFDGRNWSADRAVAYEGHQREFGMGRSVADFFLIPWRVTMWPWNYDPAWDKRRVAQKQKGFEVQPLPTSALGPALLMFVVPLLLLRRQPQVMSFLLVTSLFFLGCWFFVLAQYNRYLFPILPPLSLCAGYAVVTLSQRSQPLRYVCGAALASCCAFGLALFVTTQQSELSVAFGRVSEQERLERFNVYAVCKFVNDNLAPSAKVVTYGETRWFYLDREYLWGEREHHTLIRYDEPMTLNRLLAEYRRLGITHVLFAPTMIQGSPYQRLFEQGIQSGAFTVLYAERGFVLLEISDV
ncbi:MAG: phospholipid carrier-dependent glycosyltransferase [Abditibacteriales bacterium]|nr:phospholipid carrier-dependent glycosyltransferase [Abditibacteriales bacterium]MDW8365648.1 phospholipid carrier-dependent glycosyltransferase [Abditibacteriales bacterium]